MIEMTGREIAEMTREEMIRMIEAEGIEIEMMIIGPQEEVSHQGEDQDRQAEDQDRQAENQDRQAEGEDLDLAAVTEEVEPGWREEDRLH